jgi:hypothetical protein
MAIYMGCRERNDDGNQRMSYTIKDKIRRKMEHGSRCNSVRALVFLLRRLYLASDKDMQTFEHDTWDLEEFAARCHPSYAGVSWLDED